MWLLTGLFVLLTHYIGYWCPHCYKCEDCPQIGRSNLWCSWLYVPSYPLLTKHYISKKMKEKKHTRGSSPCLCLPATNSRESSYIVVITVSRCTVKYIMSIYAGGGG